MKAVALKPHRSFMARTGVRLALVNVVAILVAFGIAGCLALAAIQHFSRHDMRDHVNGEAASVAEEFSQKGAAHLPHTIEKRERLWRGFDYRLVDRQGRFLAGRLSADLPLGWREADMSVGGSVRRFLVLTERLPDGGRLSVGQDLAAERAELAAAMRSLMLCGALGAGFCLGVAYLFNRRAWRRLDEVIEAARDVAGGRLEARAPVRSEGEPDDLDELALTFNAMLERIATLLEQLHQVSVDIAHDMRTPLTRVHQKLERLHARTESDAELSAKVGVIQRDVAEALRIFDALLQLAEIDAADSLQHEALALDEVAARVADAFRPDIEVSGRRLEVDIARARIRGDAGLLNQVIANLLENALRHTPISTTIALKVAVENGLAHLSVADDGPGVDADCFARLLKPFVRLEHSRSKPGSGLGLSIVAAISRLHGAELRLSDARPGLKIELAFPLCRDADGVPAPTASSLLPRMEAAAAR